MKRRAALLPLLALGHVALVMLVLGAAGDARPTPSVFAIAVRAVPEEFVRPVAPLVRELEIVSQADAPQFEISVTEPADGDGGDCGVANAIGAALIRDPATPAALAAIPAGARTVANAVMLWDGQWTALPEQSGGRGVDELRRIVVATVRSVPPSCRSAAVAGPRLIVLPDGRRDIVLAFGSGNWAWSELLG